MNFAEAGEDEVFEEFAANAAGTDHQNASLHLEVSLQIAREDKRR